MAAPQRYDGSRIARKRYGRPLQHEDETLFAGSTQEATVYRLVADDEDSNEPDKQPGIKNHFSIIDGNSVERN
jgi:hypothetical protein